jgi:hypothetical protein
MLRPFEPGNKLGGRRGTAFTETQRLAREYSVDAVMTLVERLHDRDGRVAIAAAVALLDRAWGRVREAPLEDGSPPAQIDLTILTDPELQLLFKLAQSGRLRPAPTDDAINTLPIIETTTDDREAVECSNDGVRAVQSPYPVPIDVQLED